MRPSQWKRSNDLVLASALAVEDKWRDGPGKDVDVLWGDGYRDGFQLALPKHSALMSPDGRLVIAFLPLASGASLMLAMSEDGDADEALARNVHYVPLEQSSPLVHRTHLSAPDTVAVEVPTFSERADVDLCEHAEEWGLVSVLEEGVPGMGERVGLSDARQSALIDVSAMDVRAAAVTMMTLTRSAVTIPHEGLKVVFDRPFSFALGDTRFEHALFKGIHR